MQQVAQGLASLGRGDDKMLVHMTPREVAGLQSLAMAHGGSLTINPHTGLPEAGFLSSILPMALGVGASALFPAASPWMIGLGVGGVSALTSGSLAKGLQAGMGAYGGAGLGNALAGFGAENLPEQLSGPPPEVSVVPPAPTLTNVGAAPIAPIAGADTKADYMLQGAQNAFDRPMDFLGTKGVPSALASAAAPMVSNTLSGMIQPQGIKGIMPQGVPQPNYPNYRFQQTRNPNWGQPGESYYRQDYIPLAAGGQVPNPNEFYPGANIPRSTYAMPTQSPMPQSVVGDYDAPINPLTGEMNPGSNSPRYMASGGLADFKMYPDKNEISDAEDLTPSQLEAAADSDDPYLMGIASLERDRRKGAGTKGYKRKEFAHGGLADMPEYAAGGKLLRGPGDGMSDDIPAVINGPKPQRAALADGEFVIPADVVSHLGNGSTDAGAKRLYSMMDKVRHARTGNKKQGRKINAERFLPA